MEVRIGVVYTPREIVLEMGDDADTVSATIEQAVEREELAALADRLPRASGSASPSTSSPTSRSRAPTPIARLASALGSHRVMRCVVSGPDLLDRRCLFFTGKGGVGKSTMAAATALLAARTGRRVLLVEVDAKGDVPAQFEQKAVGFTPREVYPGVLAMAMDTEASLREYLRVSMRVPVIGRLGPLAQVLDFVATAAPGVKEILTIGKIMWEVREAIEGRADHDIVVVDAAATGHIVAQLGAADAIQELVDVGPLRDQTRWVSELLADPARDRGEHRHDTRGDAGHGDDRAGRAPARRGRRSARRRDRESRPARAVHAQRRGDVRGAARSPTRPRCWSRRPGGARSRCSTRRASRCRCAARARFTSRSCATRSSSRCSTCPTCSCATTACASRGWSPTRSARSSGM